jgi:hypothetical protein
MQRFISGSSLPCGEPAASGHLQGTIDQSGKEAEKPLGKVFAKMPFAHRFRRQFGAAKPAKRACLEWRTGIVNISRNKYLICSCRQGRDFLGKARDFQAAESTISSAVA